MPAAGHRPCGCDGEIRGYPGATGPPRGNGGDAKVFKFIRFFRPKNHPTPVPLAAELTLAAFGRVSGVLGVRL